MRIHVYAQRARATLDATGSRLAAGVVFLTRGMEILLLKRSHAPHGGTWGLPAGGVEGSEQPRDAAMRECREEIGSHIPVADIRPLMDYTLEGVHFHAFYKVIDAPFVVHLCPEHEESGWFNLAELPEPLHPGVEKLLRESSLAYAVLANGVQRATKTVTTDEEMGHPFHGNQYVDVAGQGQPKPTSTKSTGLKNQLHELFASGHSFTTEELMAATGSKTSSALFTALSDLKNPKYAGKHGVLEIVGGKNGGVWAIKPKAGAVPPDASKAEEIMGLLGIPGNVTMEPVKPPAPAQSTASPAAVMADLKQSIKNSETALAAPIASLKEKSEADKHYKASLDATAMQVADAAEMIGGKGLSNKEKYTLAKWAKTKKAFAMAQWAANTKGKDAKIQPQHVYQADLDFVESMHALAKSPDGVTTEGITKALQGWKDATHKGKAVGAEPILDPDAPVVHKAPPPASHVASKPKEVPVSTLKNVEPNAPIGITVPKDQAHMPSDWQHVDAAALASGQFMVDRHQIEKAFEGDSVSTVANKKAIEKALGDRLKSCPNFMAVASQYKGDSHYPTLQAGLVGAWAGSSGDHHHKSVALQMATREVFGMDASSTDFHKMDGHIKDSGGEDAVYKGAAKEVGYNANSTAGLETFKKALHEFVAAQYHNTQEYLAQKGIKELCLVRGMKTLFRKSHGMPESMSLKLQPASSFTYAMHTAKSFAGSNSLYYTRVPASLVLGSFLTGFGCTEESEIVVLAHKNLQCVEASSTMDPKVVGAAMKGEAPHSTVSLGAGMQEHIDKIVKHTAPVSSAEWKKAKITLPLPSTVPGANSAHAKPLYDVAASGNPKKFVAALMKLEAYKASTGMTFPKTTKYAEQLTSAFLSSLKKAGAASPATPATTTPVQPASNVAVSHIFGKPMKKDANFYTKLKNAIQSHPAHTEAGYKALKAEGVTNENVYKVYEHMNKGGSGALKAMMDGLKASGDTATGKTFVDIHNNLKKDNLL